MDQQRVVPSAWDAKKRFPAEPIVIRFRARAGLEIALTALVAAPVGLLGYFSTHSTADLIRAVIWIGLAGFAFCWGMRKFWRPPAAYIIDGKGVARLARFPFHIFWSDLKGAHHATLQFSMYATFYTRRSQWKIIALELADPNAFQRRRKVYYSGFSTGFIPDYFPIPCRLLDIDPNELLRIIIEGIEQNSRLVPDPAAPTFYEVPHGAFRYESHDQSF